MHSSVSRVYAVCEGNFTLLRKVIYLWWLKKKEANLTQNSVFRFNVKNETHTGLKIRIETVKVCSAELLGVDYNSEWFHVDFDI